MQLRSRLVGLPRERRLSACFHAEASATLSSYRPLNQLRPGSSFFGVPPPQSSFAHFSRPAPFSEDLPTQGLIPHRGTTRRASTSYEGCQAFAPFRPQAFAASRRFTPPSGFAGLFHPAATSRVVAVQGLLSPRSGWLSSSPHSPLPLSSRLLTDLPCGPLSLSACDRVPPPWKPRLRGFALREAALLSGRGLASPQLAPLFGFFSSRSSTTAFDSSFPRAIRSQRFPSKLFASEFFRPRDARLLQVALSVF
jgi:hypothetical protein